MHLDTPCFTGDASRVLARWTIALGVVAAAPEEQVVVSGDGTCLTPAGVEARTRAWAPHTQWQEDVVVTVDHRGTDLRIELVGPAGERIERSFADVPAECRDVELMAAVAVAMALEAYPTSHAVAPVDTPPPVAKPIEASASSTASPSVSSRRRASPAIELALAGGGGFGVLPFATGELAFGARVQWGRVWWVGDVELGARVVTSFDGENGRLSLVRTAVATGVCSPWTRARWTAALCGLLAAGPLFAGTYDTLQPRASWVPWFAGVLRTEVGLALGRRWSLGVRTDLMIGIVRPTVGVTRDGQPQRWRTPTFGFRGALVVGVRIGGPVKRGAGRRMEGSK
jgi:hypothetical protein